MNWFFVSTKPSVMVFTFRSYEYPRDNTPCLISRAKVVNGYNSFSTIECRCGSTALVLC